MFVKYCVKDELISPITAINIIDKDFDKNEDAHIVSGGIGSTNVSILVTTKPSSGLEFLVQIYI